MKEAFGVFLTDGVNRRRELLPASSIIEAMERQARDCRETGLPIGLPMNVSHDRCRAYGWSRATGLHFARDMARQIGVILTPEDAADRAEIQAAIDAFDAHHVAQSVAPYAEALRARVPGEGLHLTHMEATFLVGPRLAARAYPELFELEGGLVDKDGLVDYPALLRRTRLLQPGVFHDLERDVVLFAHPFFRRSLSRRNALNPYVLETFHRIATAGDGMTARLRLDPDVLGHPDSVRRFIELEYWRGPRFTDDIAAIPNGVAEHKATPDQRFYSGVDNTQVWWKHPEARHEAARGEYAVRTFEVEELVEDPSPGLSSSLYGCRYAHAEYDLERTCISHFDGAVRAYPGEAYLERIERAIDRAGKHAAYTKLFRLDGRLPVADWKRLLSDFYRGNRLIPEYLGAPKEADDEDLPPSCVDGRRAVPALTALLNVNIASEEPALEAVPSVLPEMVQRIGDADARLAEVGRGAVADLMRGWTDEERAGTAEIDDSLANLSTINLGAGAQVGERWREVALALASALSAEARAKRIVRVSLAVCWTRRGLLMTLSFAGMAECVVKLLEAAAPIVRPDQSAAVWADDFQVALHACAPELQGPVEWSQKAVTRGRLELDRTRDAEVRFRLPDADMARIKAQLKLGKDA